MAIRRAMHAPATGLNSMVNHISSGDLGFVDIDDHHGHFARPAELNVRDPCHPSTAQKGIYRLTQRSIVTVVAGSRRDLQV